MRIHQREDVGVTWSKERKKWQAKIANKGKQYAKRFDDKQEAINWRKEKEIDLWGIVRQF